jgi:hypothetical protein
MPVRCKSWHVSDVLALTRYWRDGVATPATRQLWYAINASALARQWRVSLDTTVTCRPSDASDSSVLTRQWRISLDMLGTDQFWHASDASEPWGVSHHTSVVPQSLHASYASVLIRHAPAQKINGKVPLFLYGTNYPCVTHGRFLPIPAVDHAENRVIPLFPSWRECYPASIFCTEGVCLDMTAIR